ncbi:hypothetical protein BgiBS90_014041, partial [Biomphalaria glabrata]
MSQTVDSGSSSERIQPARQGTHFLKSVSGVLRFNSSTAYYVMEAHDGTNILLEYTVFISIRK